MIMTDIYINYWLDLQVANNQFLLVVYIVVNGFYYFRLSYTLKDLKKGTVKIGSNLI